MHVWRRHHWFRPYNNNLSWIPLQQTKEGSCISLKVKQGDILLSGQTKIKWCRINVDATWSRRIDVDTTSFWCCLPAGLDKRLVLFWTTFSMIFDKMSCFMHQYMGLFITIPAVVDEYLVHDGVIQSPPSERWCIFRLSWFPVRDRL